MADAAGGQRRLILGSASPRRAALLTQLGLDFEIASADIDEEALLSATDGDGTISVAAIARAKFDAVDLAGRSGALLTADTLVACDGSLLGKPASDVEVASMLKAMAGRELTISTGLCLGPVGGEPQLRLVSTTVRLTQLDGDQIDRYVESGAGRGKAGALSLQNEANSFIAAIDGCWSNVVGLPVCSVAELLDLEPRGVSRVDRCPGASCGQ